MVGCLKAGRHCSAGHTALLTRLPPCMGALTQDDGSAESSGLYANGGLNHMHGGYGAPPGGGYGPAGSYGAPPPLYAQQQQYGPPQAYAPPSPPMAAFAQPPQQQQGALDWQAQQQLQAALAALIPQAAPAPVPAPAPNLQHLQLLQTVLGVMQGAPAGLNSPAVQGLLSSLLGSGPPPPPQQQQPQQWGGELMPPPPPQQPMPQPASQAMLASLLQHVSALPAGADAQQARSAAADLMAGLVRRTAAGTPPAAAAQPIGATRHAGSSLDLLAGAAAADGSGATDADALNGTSTAATATAVATATVDDGWGTSDGDQDEEEDEEGVDDFVEPKSGPRAPPGGQPGDEAPIAKRARVDGGLALAAALQGTSPLNMGQLRGLQQLAVAGPPLPAAAQRQAPAAAAVGAAAPPSEAQQLEQQLLAALPDLSQTADLLRRAAEQLQAHLLAQRLLQEHAVPLAVQLPSSCQLLGAHAGAAGWVHWVLGSQLAEGGGLLIASVVYCCRSCLPSLQASPSRHTRPCLAYPSPLAPRRAG